MPAPLRRLSLALAIAAIGGPALAADDPVELPEVRVSGAAYANGEASHGYRSDQVRLGPLGNGSSQDTPVTVNSVSAEFIANTQAANTGEALKYVATVYNSTGASQITPYFAIRGLSASTWTYNMAVDGMRSFDIYQPMEDKAGIEVLSGTSGFLYGITSPAGMINYNTKRPTRAPLAEITVGLYDRQLYGAIDLGGALAGRSDLAYRFNLGLANAGDTGTEDMSQERYSIAGAIDWQLTADTLLSFDAARARRDIEQPQALFVPSLASGIPKAPDASKNWGPQDGHTHDLTSRLGLAVESRLNDVFSLRGKFRYSDGERSYLMGRQYWQNADLDYRWRLDAHDKHRRSAWQTALFLDAAFATGPLQHKLSFGGTYDDFHQGWNGYSSLFTAAAPASWFAGNLGGPAWAPALTTKPGTEQQQDTRYTTWMLADRIAIGERWEVLLGGTWAEVDDRVKNRSATGVVTPTVYEKQEFTPAVAISFKPLPALTAYLSYMEGLEQGVVSTAPGNTGEVLPPSVSKQKEVGVKATLGGMLLTAAWFDIDKANVMTENDITSLDGRARYKGLEFSASGRLTRRLVLVGGLTLLDAEVKKAANPLSEGKTPEGAPERMARLYAEYDLAALPGLTLTGGLSHVGKIPQNAANTLELKAVTLGDLGLRYERLIAGRKTTWRVAVSNIADKRYWTGRSVNLYPGAPRTVMASATVAF